MSAPKLSPTTLTISHLDIAHGARTLLTDLNLVLSDGDVTALVGINGSGKSTLLRMLGADLPVDSGTVTLAPPSATIAWLPQVTPDPSLSLRAYVRERTGVAGADLELEQSARALADGVAGSADRYAEAFDRWMSLGAADLDSRLPAMCARLGLAADPDRSIGTLSGGQVARVNLLAIVLSHYDLLLLDEPTNNLDDAGLALLTEFVTSHTGPVLVASHDRAFLDAVATSVVDLDLRQQAIGHYHGNYTAFQHQRELARAQSQQRYTEFADTRDGLMDQAAQRREWAGLGRSPKKLAAEPDKHIREKYRARADRQASKAARITAAVDRLDAVPQPRKEWELRYRLDAGAPSADAVAGLSEAVITRSEPEVEGAEFVLGPLSLAVNRGDRIAVLGPNGSGKTTLLRALFGDLPLRSGHQHTGTRVRLGWLDQDRAQLDTEHSVLRVVGETLGPRAPCRLSSPIGQHSGPR